MTLHDFCNSLPNKKRFELAIRLARKALPAWNDHTLNIPVTYRDTVAGLTHTIPQQLLADTITEVEKYIATPVLLRLVKGNTRLHKLYAYFDDPVIALQDADWKPPRAVERVFYAVYNLAGAVTGKDITGFDEKTICVSVNQSIDAIETARLLSKKEIEEILREVKEQR